MNLFKDARNYISSLSKEDIRKELYRIYDRKRFKMVDRKYE